jgi:hypothetical protein
MRQGATSAGPHPGDFRLGSKLSRAAARAMLEKRETACDADPCLTVVVTNVAAKLTLEEDAIMQILRDCGYLKRNSYFKVVHLCRIPNGLSAEELEQFLRERGAELC